MMYSAIYNIPAATPAATPAPAVKTEIEAAFTDYNEANGTNYRVDIPKSGVMPTTKNAQGKSIANFLTTADKDTTDAILSDGGIVSQCWGFQTFHIVYPATYTYKTVTVPEQLATYGDRKVLVSAAIPAVEATYDTVAVLISAAVPATYDEQGNELTPYIPAVYSETEVEHPELTPYVPAIGAVYETENNVELTPYIAAHDIEEATEVAPALPEVIVPVHASIVNFQDDRLDINGDPTGQKIGLHRFTNQAEWEMA